MELRRESQWEYALKQMWAEYYINRSTMASIDIVVPSLYVIWSEYQIVGVWMEIHGLVLRLIDDWNRVLWLKTLCKSKR